MIDRLIRYGGLAAATLLVVGVTLSAARGAMPEPYRVIDGDTIAVQGKTYRLAWYDTPETYRPRCSRELVKGTAAKHLLTALLSNPTAAFIPLGRFDVYGRELAEVVVENTQVFTLMIQAKLALPYGPNVKRRTNWCQCLAKGTCGR